jgi:hypothetical protein
MKLGLPTIAASVLLSAAALAESADDGKGRYALTPVDGGVLRLDKDTGAMALCTHKADQWICEPVQDRSKDDADQLAKLEAENKSLKDRVKVLEDSLAIAEGANKNDAPGEPPGGRMQLPTEEEVDKALDYVERIFKKFRDRIDKYEKSNPGAPGGEHSAPL